MAIDLLLEANNRGGPRRIGDIGENAPHVILISKGEDAILPMPVTIASANRMFWDQKDQSQGLLGAKAIQQISLADSAQWENILSKDNLNNLVSGTGTALASKILPVGGIDQDFFFHRQGKAVNSNKEMAFSGIGFRTFSFEWELIPTKESESVEILDFIQFFQKHAAPDLIEGKTFFSYPDAWEIIFSEPGLPLIMTCYLTDYNINYGAAGRMQLHNGGFPIQTNINLVFTEAELHTKEKITGGLFG